MLMPLRIAPEHASAKQPWGETVGLISDLIPL